MFCPACGDDRDDAGRCYGCGTVSRDPRQEHTATPDEARDWNWSPEERDLWEQETEQGRPDGEPGCHCFYQHEGPCPSYGDEEGLDRTAESLRHSRPGEFYSEITRNWLHDPASYKPEHAATHVMTGYMGDKVAGHLHFAESDDGKAHEVHMLHTDKRFGNRGVGSAMMDDLYSHVKGKGGWLDHGVRTKYGNNWWSGYSEPHPEVNIHHAHPDEGWAKYFNPDQVAGDAASNFADSEGRGAHTPLNYSPGNYQQADRHRDSEWTKARGITPSQQATAALVAAGEDLDEIIALAQLAGVTGEPFRFTADQANSAWGSENVSQHPPVKPYGATEPPNKDQDPGSYGFLSAPDPENWGSIQQDSIYQSSPMSTDAALLPGGPYDQDAPADPDGVLAELRGEPEPALPETTGDEMRGQSQAEGLADQAQVPSPVTQEPGMGSMDDSSMMPDDQSIQSMGAAQSEDDIVAAFQRSAAARGLSGGGGGVQSDGDIAARAREFLKTADVLPEAEAAALISEGRGERARNLSLLKLEGTHYADQDDDLHGRGLSLDDFDDDVAVV
jgi:ribosomal protein S18 acetylase RimI-like enzyme